MSSQRPPTDPEDELEALLTIEQIAELIQSSTRHVRRLIADGQLEAIHIGRLVRIRPQSARRLLNQGTAADSKGKK